MPKQKIFVFIYMKSTIRFSAQIITNSFFTYTNVLSTDWGWGRVCRTVLVGGDCPARCRAANTSGSSHTKCREHPH